MLDSKYDNLGGLLNIADFAKQSKLNESEVLQYILDGLLFPLAPTRSGILIRRIPSMLTENLFYSVLDKKSYNELINKPFTYFGYEEYKSEWDKFMSSFRHKVGQYNIDIRENYYLPLFSDIQYTNNGYVFVTSDVVFEAKKFGFAHIKQFVDPRPTRGFYFPDNPTSMYDLYALFKASKRSPNKIYDGLINRYCTSFYKIYDMKVPLCYPDVYASSEYLDLLNLIFPVSLWAISNFLGGELANIITDLNYLSADHSFFYKIGDEINRLINQVDGDDRNRSTFFNLVIASTYLDKWIPLFHGKNDFICTYDSLMLQAGQIDYARKIKDSNLHPVSFYDNSRERFVNYGYCIMRSFLNQLLIIKDDKRFESQAGLLEAIIDECIENAQNDFSGNEYFKSIYRMVSGRVGDYDFTNYIRTIEKNPCSIFFKAVPDKTKNKTQKAKFHKSDVSLELVATGNMDNYPSSVDYMKQLINSLENNGFLSLKPFSSKADLFYKYYNVKYSCNIKLG